LLERIDAVADAGWAGIGLLHADLTLARDTIGYSKVARAISSAGLKYVEVEFLGDWWTGGEARAQSDRVRRDLFEALDALGAQTVKAAGQMFSDSVNIDTMAKEFDALASEAGSRGARIALEALPFSNFSTIGKGSAFLEMVGNPHGGLILDIWHLYRGGNVPEDLPTILNPDYLFAVELNDAAEPAPRAEELWHDTITNRKLPGEEDWDVPGLINVLRDLGYAGVWGVEILSDEHRAKSLHDEVTSAIVATRSVFTEADDRR